MKLSRQLQSLWGQCGGINYVGPMNCPAEAVCSRINQYYSQCVPATALPTLNPSRAPSTFPSTSPTLLSSLRPSEPPSQAPQVTTIPSLQPSNNPSLRRTFKPTQAPSLKYIFPVTFTPSSSVLSSYSNSNSTINLATSIIAVVVVVTAVIVIITVYIWKSKSPKSRADSVSLMGEKSKPTAKKSKLGYCEERDKQTDAMVEFINKQLPDNEQSWMPEKTTEKCSHYGEHSKNAGDIEVNLPSAVFDELEGIYDKNSFHIVIENPKSPVDKRRSLSLDAV